MYLKKLNHTIFAFLLFTFACQSIDTADQPSDLTGHWMMHAVIQEGKDVTVEHNPEKD